MLKEDNQQLKQNKHLFRHVEATNFLDLSLCESTGKSVRSVFTSVSRETFSGPGSQV